MHTHTHTHPQHITRISFNSCCVFDLLALVGRVLGLISAVVESSFEQLDGDHSKDELEQHVDDHDVDHVLE